LSIPNLNRNVFQTRKKNQKTNIKWRITCTAEPIIRNRETALPSTLFGLFEEAMPESESQKRTALVIARSAAIMINRTLSLPVSVAEDT